MPEFLQSPVLFLHVLGATGVGFYLVLPFLVSKVCKLSGDSKSGLAQGLVLVNRIAQYFLFVQFITGGLLMSYHKDFYAVSWMIVITIVLFAMFALGGIISKPLKLIVANVQAGTDTKAQVKKAGVLSIILLVLFIVEIYFMKFPILQ